MNARPCFPWGFLFLLIGSLLAACAGSAAPAPTASAPPTAAPAAAAPEPTQAPAAPTAGPTRSPASATVQESNAVQLTVESFMFTSEALKGNKLGDPTERAVQVILPAGYAQSAKHYPVVYFLHGYDAGLTTQTREVDLALKWYKDWAAVAAPVRTGATGNLLEAIQQGVQTSGQQEMIFVFPNARNALYGTFYLSSPASGDVETYLTQDLVDYIDNRYRTLTQRESRAIAGCSVGGDGAVHLGFKYPSVYAVVVAQDGFYFWDEIPMLTGTALTGFRKAPADLAEFRGMIWETQAMIALAAGVSPDDTPAWSFAMPYVVVDGKARVAPSFLKQAQALDPRSDVLRYAEQPVRLNAVLVQHGHWDPYMPVELGRKFDALLTEQDVPHEFVDTYNSHCTFDTIPPMLQFLSDELVGENTQQ